MKKKVRLQKQFAPKPQLKIYGKRPGTADRNYRWCELWTRGAIRKAGIILIIGAILLILINLLTGCETTKKQPVVWEEESVVRYEKGSVERAHGFIGKTQYGNYVVTAGYVEWAEGRNIDAKAAEAKLEQERISKLGPVK